MKIQLSEDTAQSVRDYKLWDPTRSHDFVSSYQLDHNIQVCVRGILDSQLGLNQGRDKSIFALSGCLSYIDTMYSDVVRHPNMKLDQRLACIGDSMTVIDDDLNSRILVYHRFKGNLDFEPYNTHTLQLMEKIALGRNDNVALMYYDAELASLFGVTTEVGKFKMDKMQHICSAMSTLFWEMYSNGEYTEEIRLCDFISDLLFSIEGVFPNVLKDENTDLFWSFVESVEDIMGFSYQSINYFIDENDTVAIQKLDLLITKMYQFLRNIIMVDKCQEVYGKSFQEFIEIRNQIMQELGFASPDFTADTSSTGIIKDYGELLFNVAVSLVSEALEQIWTLYINSNGETDCFTGSICRKLTLITLYLMTNNLDYLNFISEVDI